MTPEQYPETLSDLVDCVADTLARIDDTPTAMAVVEGIRRRFGGSLLYIPKGRQMDREARDKAIADAFDGRNHRELASRFGITVSVVYRILSEARKGR